MGTKTVEFLGVDVDKLIELLNNALADDIKLKASK